MKKKSFGKPLISVIIPVHNGERTIGRCLKSVYESGDEDFEVIVVDDGSIDKTCEIAEEFSAKVVRLDENRGAAIARNRGAELARGEILLFLDADVLVRKNILNLAFNSFQDNPGAVAIQGIYDRECPVGNLPSLYKHYYNCYKFAKVSDRFLPSASSFCLLVMKKVFQEVGGFDEGFPFHSAAEDVDLAFRLKRESHRILLDRKLKVVHLKPYTLWGLLRTEFVKVGSNMKLMLRSKSIRDYPVSKNKKKDFLNVIFSVLLSPLILASLIGLLLFPGWASLGTFLGLAAVFVGLNGRFLNFIRKEKGILITLGCLLVAYLDMLVAQAALVWGLIDFKVFKREY